MLTLKEITDQLQAQNTALTSIDFFRIDLENADIAQFRALMRSISNSYYLKKIILKSSWLWRWDNERFDSFMEALDSAFNLQELDLEDNQIGWMGPLRGLKLIGTLSSMVHLQQVNLSLNALYKWREKEYDICMNIFVRWVSSSKILKSLNIGFNSISFWEARLMKGLSNSSSLKSLTIDRTDLWFFGSRKLTAFLQNLLKINTLTALDLNSNQLWSRMNGWYKTHFTVFSQYLAASNLKYLNLSNNNLGAKYYWGFGISSLKTLAEGVNASKILHLDLSENNVGDWTKEYLEVLASIIESKPHYNLTKLSLNRNRIDRLAEDKFEIILNALRKRPLPLTLQLEDGTLQNPYQYESYRKKAREIHASKTHYLYATLAHTLVHAETPKKTHFPKELILYVFSFLNDNQNLKKQIAKDIKLFLK